MRVLIAAGFAAVITGCSLGDRLTGGANGQEAVLERDVGVAREQPVAQSSVKPGPTIVTLRSRDGSVTIHASELGPLFTITKEDGTKDGGQVKAEALSLAELEERFPDVYRAYRSSIAGEGLIYAGAHEGVREDVGIKTVDLDW